MPTKPSSKSSAASAPKAKLFIICAVLGLCLLWLGYNLAGSLRGPGVAQAPTSPGALIVKDLNIKLSERPEFADVGFTVESESPLHFKVMGAVHKQSDLPKLTQFLKEIRPEEDYEINVAVLN